MIWSALGPPRDPATQRLEQTRVARELLPSLGIDPARLTFEERSRDTCESAANARALLKPGAARPGWWCRPVSTCHA